MKARRGRPPRFSPQDQDLLRSLLREDPEHTLVTLALRFAKLTDTQPAPSSTLHETLARMGIHIQRKKFVAQPEATPDPARYQDRLSFPTGLDIRAISPMSSGPLSNPCILPPRNVWLSPDERSSTPLRMSCALAVNGARFLTIFPSGTPSTEPTLVGPSPAPMQDDHPFRVIDGVAPATSERRITSVLEYEGVRLVLRGNMVVWEFELTTYDEYLHKALELQGVSV